MLVSHNLVCKNGAIIVLFLDGEGDFSKWLMCMFNF